MTQQPLCARHCVRDTEQRRKQISASVFPKGQKSLLSIVNFSVLAHNYSFSSWGRKAEWVNFCGVIAISNQVWDTSISEGVFTCAVLFNFHNSLQR